MDDGAEIRLGTDPLVADTDGDGVLDGNETYQTNTSNSSLGVSLSLTGNGDIANDTTIELQDDPMFNSSRVDNMSHSPVVELESEQNFSSANVTMAYNETGVTNESQELTVFTYDPEIGIFVPLNSTIDTENNTVTAETTHFSTFAVYNLETWETTYDAEEPVRESDDDGIVPVDVALVMDTSGSMRYDDELRNQAGQQFVSGLLDMDRAAVVDFDSSASVEEGLTSDFSAVNSTLDSLGAFGGTDIGDGVSAANSHFESQSNDSRAQVMILLTDGQGSGGISEAETAADRNTTIHTIGFDNADQDKLQEIANITGGEYNYVADSSDLPQVFSRVANNTTDITDSDGDGLSNRQETEGMILGSPTGAYVQTNPNQSDTDDDGLADGQEVGEHQEVERRFSRTDTTYTVSFYEYTSNPTRLDSDSDGVPDGDEVNEWGTDPLDPDTSGDGLNDLVDPAPTEETYPPAFEYDTSNDYFATFLLNPVGISPGTIQDITIIAGPTGSADSIQEIRVQQYSEPPMDSGSWNNQTFTEEDFSSESDGRISVSPRFGDQDGLFAPTEFRIVVIDSNGNPAIINQDIENEIVNISAVVTPTSTYAQTTPAVYAGATAGAGGAYYGATTTGVSISSGGVVVSGAVVSGAAQYVVVRETTGSAQGTVQSYSRTIPATEVVQQWEGEDLYSVSLYSNNDIELPLRLPAGDVYEAPSGDEGMDRGFGEDYIYRTPGINSQEDIDQVIQNPNAIEQDGDYTLAIGDNPNGEGSVGIWLNDGFILAADRLYEDINGQQIILPDNVVNKILNRHQNVGQSEEEVRETVQNILQNPDEVYEDPEGYRMYIKRIDGEIFVLFVSNRGYVQTAFRPELSDGTYTEQRAIEYIEEQIERFGFTKIVEENQITDENLGE